MGKEHFIVHRDMGLGKTVQTIDFMLSKAGEGASLVVAPTSVVPNWASEIRRFAPGLRPVILNQAKDRAHRIGQKRDVTVIRLISEHTIEEKILWTIRDDFLDLLPRLTSQAFSRT